MRKERPLEQDKYESEFILNEDTASLGNVEEDRVIGPISWKLYGHYLQAGMYSVIAGAMVIFSSFSFKVVWCLCYVFYFCNRKYLRNYIINLSRKLNTEKKKLSSDALITVL